MRSRFPSTSLEVCVNNMLVHVTIIYMLHMSFFEKVFLLVRNSLSLAFQRSKKLWNRSIIRKVMVCTRMIKKYGFHELSWRSFKLNEFASWWGRVKFRCGKTHKLINFHFDVTFFVYWPFPTFFGPLESYVSRDLYFTKYHVQKLMLHALMFA